MCVRLRPKARARAGQGEGKHEADGVVGRGAETGPLDAGAVRRRVGRLRAEDVVRDRDREVEPHAEQPEERQQLDEPKSEHVGGHLAPGKRDFPDGGAKAGVLLLIAAEGLEILGRVLPGGDDRPQHGQQKGGSAEVKRQPHRCRDGVRSAVALRDMKDVRQQPGQRGRDHGTEADEEALHGESRRALPLREEIGDKRAERFHADVDGRVQNPKRAGGHPERAAAWHEEEHGGGEDGAHEKIRPAAAERTPRAVARVADERLDDETAERRGKPEDGQLVRRGAEHLVDGAHVGQLQRPPELDAEEAKAHVPYLPEAAAGLLHRGDRTLS